MHQSPLVKDLHAALGRGNVIFAPSELAVYDCDAFTLARNRPDAVAFPRSADEFAAVVKICNRHGAAIVPRGAGTGLAGGCLPGQHSVVVMLTRISRVLEISLRDRWAIVEAGATNWQLNKALAGTGYCFAAEPSTQGASTIGGNAATNASGSNVIKYGTAVHHILGLEAVLSNGAIVQFGPINDPAGFDLIGLLVGGEGTLAIITKIWLRLTPKPQDYRTIQAIFDSANDAAAAVSQILAAAIVPSAIELMDQAALAAVNESFQNGTASNAREKKETSTPRVSEPVPFFSDAMVMLLIEIDGPAAGLEEQQQQIISICKKNLAKYLQQASTDEDRRALWKYRKSAISAAGRICPTYLIEDCVVPRGKLPRMLQKISDVGREHEVRILNVAHAGDGNLHPIILYDENDEASVGRAMTASRELIEASIELGGSATAEHGVGARKVDFMPRQFSPADLKVLEQVRHSFDPSGLFNPDKLLPINNDNSK